jgi:hypothetical protein
MTINPAPAFRKCTRKDRGAPGTVHYSCPEPVPGWCTITWRTVRERCSTRKPPFSCCSLSPPTHVTTTRLPQTTTPSPDAPGSQVRARERTERLRGGTSRVLHNRTSPHAVPCRRLFILFRLFRTAGFGCALPRVFETSLNRWRPPPRTAQPS